MFKGLRLRLSMLYLLAAFVLIVLLGGGAYVLLNNYFRQITDASLQHKMAHEFLALGATLPPELEQADTEWYLQRGQVLPERISPTQIDLPLAESYRLRQDEERHAENEEYYSGEMALLFVLPLDANGILVSDPNPIRAQFAPDHPAFENALKTGKDVRTTLMGNSIRVRLLSYALIRNHEWVVLQIGRDLRDQDRTLRYLLLTILGLGLVCALLVGLGSWWMAGRSLQPTVQAWTKQQAFIANASHELRAPLTLMRASVEMAQRQLPINDQDSHQLLQDALNENDYMGQLVNDMLLLSRLDVEVLKLEYGSVDVSALIDELVRQVRRVTDEHGITLQTQVTGMQLWADKARLRQVLLTLINNALEHTPTGGSITISTAPKDKRGEIAIADTGTGIAPEHVPHVFDRFYRASTQARGDHSESSGLGLALAQSLIHAQQGSIRLTSQLNSGTRVIIELPLAPALAG